MSIFAQNYSQDTSAKDMTGVIDEFNNDVFILLTNPPVYNKHLPPQEHRPIQVNISILLYGFGSIDESKTEFNLQLLVRFTWLDHRLRPWNATVDKGKNMTIFEGGSWHLDRLWTPSLHVANSRMPKILQDQSQNPILTRIQSDGQILVSKRISLQGLCQMDFRLYPLDVQDIDFVIESNELSYENMQLGWSTLLPLDTEKNFVWNGYEMISYDLRTETSNYTYTGTFSKVIATFHLNRVIGQFVLDVYVPIYLYVFISWGSFWIEVTAAPARVTLGVTILLTMVTTSRSAREKLPPVSYIHALDIFITTSIVFVFAVLVEYTFVNYIYFRHKRSSLKKRKRLKSMRMRQIYENKKRSNLNFDSKSLNGVDNLSFDSIAASNDINITITTDLNETYCVEQSSNQDQSSFQSSSTLPSNDIPSNFLIRWMICLSRYVRKWIRERAYKRKYGKRKRNVEGSEETAYEIDRICRIAFPSLFFIFNIIYWLVIAISSGRLG